MTKSRSNRPLTQFACRNLGFFLEGRYQGTGSRSEGNTAVHYEIERSRQRFTVRLFDQAVLIVTCYQWKPISICVSFTSFYDMYGQPTKTTCERLNGLLDELGLRGLLPDGVRVFRDPSFKLTYLGKGDDKIAVGKGLAESVFIRPGSTQLDIVGDLTCHDIAV